MRNMSFSLTTRQVRDGTKTVTRRFGWWGLKPGDRVMACVKCMGLGKGGRVERIREIEIISVRAERADAILSYNNPVAEVAREGFAWSPADFLELLLRSNKRRLGETVNRIEFRYVGESINPDMETDR